VHNYNAAVRESGEKIIFLRKILPGSADRSYGIQVARLAGLPAAALRRAQQLLTHFEASAQRLQTTAELSEAVSTPPAGFKAQRQLSLFDHQMTQLVQELRTLALQDLSPSDAYAKLAEFQHKAQRLP
jgi:DNA mismatch repair protein MutS